jgi:transposase
MRRVGRIPPRSHRPEPQKALKAPPVNTKPSTFLNGKAQAKSPTDGNRKKSGVFQRNKRVAAFARAWRDDRRRAERTAGRETYVLLVFQPGETFQFDWSEDWANIGGERVKLQVAHIKLSHSRAYLVRAYPLQTYEMLFDAHWHAFRVFGEVPGRGIYDNLKTAVDRVGKGKQRDINARFKAIIARQAHAQHAAERG